jgi:rare lipoprotein A
VKKLLSEIHYVLFAIFFTSVSFSLTLNVSAQKKRTPATTAKYTYTSKKVLYGEASFYANKFNGRRTANGEIFSQNKFTCACNVLPLGTWIKVTNIRNGKSVIVKVNDRLHPKMRRIVDLAKVAAKKLGYTDHGVTRVKVEVLGKTKPK